MPFLSHALSITCPFLSHALSYHMPFLSHALSITCPFYHMPFLSHALSITCLFYHMPFLSHALSITCPLYHMPFLSHTLSITCPFSVHLNIIPLGSFSFRRFFSLQKYKLCQFPPIRQSSRHRSYSQFLHSVHEAEKGNLYLDTTSIHGLVSVAKS
jgi:hypothetical protein